MTTDWFHGHLFRPTHDNERVACIYCEVAVGSDEARVDCEEVIATIQEG